MTSAAKKGNTANTPAEPRPVTTNQNGVHEHLPAVVRKHLLHPFLKPIRAVNREAFARLSDWLGEQHKPLILDSYCGTGESTRWLASRYPDHAVVGIDKSAARLERHRAENAADNYLLLRGDTDDLWRLLLQSRWRPQRHCLFYPNPWPKAAHLLRRCHGSPLFPVLLALGGDLELRSNWRLYAEEFCTALDVAGFAARVEKLTVNQPVTAFERKYHNAGQILWRSRCRLPSAPPGPL